MGILGEVLEGSLRPIILSGKREARVSQLCLCRTDSLALLRMTSPISRKTRYSANKCEVGSSYLSICQFSNASNVTDPENS